MVQYNTFGPEEAANPNNKYKANDEDKERSTDAAQDQLEVTNIMGALNIVVSVIVSLQQTFRHTGHESSCFSNKRLRSRACDDSEYLWFRGSLIPSDML